MRGAEEQYIESSHTQRGRQELEEPVNNWHQPKFRKLYSLQPPRDLQQFFFFNGYGYADVSRCCFPLVTVHVHVLLVPIVYLAKPIYCLFRGNHFYGRTNLPPFAEFNHVHWSSWYSDNHFVAIIFSRMKQSTSADATTPAGHGDIPVIGPILSMYLSTTFAVFNTCRSH